MEPRTIGNTEPEEKKKPNKQLQVKQNPYKGKIIKLIYDIKLWSTFARILIKTRRQSKYKIRESAEVPIWTHPKPNGEVKVFTNISWTSKQPDNK